MKLFKTAAVFASAVVLSATAAFSATIDGTASYSGDYSVVTAPASLGDTFTIRDTFSIGSGGTGDFSTLSSGGLSLNSLSSFALIASSAPTSNNSGTSFTFGGVTAPLFTFTIASTELATIDNVGLEVFGLGTITGGGFDPSTASFRLNAAGAGTSTSTTGSFSLFIAAPPERLTPVPLPAGGLLLLSGMGVLALRRRKTAA